MRASKTKAKSPKSKSTPATRRLIFERNDKGKFGALCVRQFWMLQARIAGDIEQRIPFELHFASDEEDIQVKYVEDPIADCRYVIVGGKHAAKACKLIEESIDIWENGALLAAWDTARSDADRIAAILRIGAAAPVTFEKRFAKRMKQGLRHEDRAVREAAIVAIAYQDWPEFDEPLREVADNDADERCRKRASIMLEIRAKRAPTA